jgi:hypothetical protein
MTRCTCFQQQQQQQQQQYFSGYFQSRAPTPDAPLEVGKLVLEAFKSHPALEDGASLSQKAPNVAVHLNNLVVALQQAQRLPLPVTAAGSVTVEKVTALDSNSNSKMDMSSVHDINKKGKFNQLNSSGGSPMSIGSSPTTSSIASPNRSSPFFKKKLLQAP